MNKERFLRIYTKLNIYIGVLLILFVVIFMSTLPKEFNSLVETNVFSITFVQLSGNIVLLNTPLIVFITLLVLNLFLLFRVGDTSQVEEKPLQTVVFYNVIITLMLIIGQIAFVLMIPENISGLIQNRYILFTFQTGASSTVHVIFGTLALSIAYFVYNFIVNRKVRIEEIEEEEEIFYDVNLVEGVEEEVKN